MKTDKTERLVDKETQIISFKGLTEDRLYENACASK